MDKVDNLKKSTSYIDLRASHHFTKRRDWNIKDVVIESSNDSVVCK
jgi:hypothetical protein